MNVTLSSRMRKFIEDKVKAGEFASADEVIEAGLVSLARQEKSPDFAPGELDSLLDEGERDVERGHFIDGEEAFRELGALSAARKRGESR